MPINTMINTPLISIPPSSTQPNMNLINMPIHTRPQFDNFINTSNSAQPSRRY